jgi:hypothetical protein
VGGQLDQGNLKSGRQAMLKATGKDEMGALYDEQPYRHRRKSMGHLMKDYRINLSGDKGNKMNENAKEL